MKLWERLKREIGNHFTTIYAHRGQVKQYDGILYDVNDCFSIDYGPDGMDFNFVSNAYNIYQLIDKSGLIVYENPRALNYQDNFTSFEDVVLERYRLFGSDYIKSSIVLRDEYISNEIKYSENYKTQFDLAISNNKNNLSYWYPRIKNSGFKTPTTETYNLTEDIVNPLIKFIDSRATDSASFNEYKTNLLNLISLNTTFKNGDKIFIKSGVFSNKFNFDCCTIQTLEEIPLKFYQIFKRELKQARGTAPSEIVLREFIYSSSNRKTVYNGMPLNTEFRVFYDFDNKKVLGIENYWNSDKMEHGLKNNQDINNYLDEKYNIFQEFNNLKPRLESLCEKLKKTELSGYWSVDFMWNGEEFVLIDMALAECSAYWEKFQHLSINGINPETIELPDGVLPKQVIELMNKTQFINQEILQDK